MGPIVAAMTTIADLSSFWNERAVTAVASRLEDTDERVREAALHTLLMAQFENLEVIQASIVHAHRAQTIPWAKGTVAPVDWPIKLHPP